jgi:crotonobetainyl-CoA:carnitine CoA-transferase CaiB-like acyl-CoA transferase
MRRIGPFPAAGQDPEQSVAHLYYNASKSSRVVDIATDGGRGELLRMLSDADVLVHAWTDSRADALALGDAELSAANPRLRTMAVTHWGRRGPYAGRPANELTIEALCGFASMHGDPPRAPLKMPGHQYECFAGTYAAIGAIASLLGGPSRVEVSVLEAALIAIESRLVSWEFTRRAPKRRLASFDAFYPLGIWPAADGDLVLAFYHPRDWEGLALLLGDEELHSGDGFRNNIRRVRNREAVDARLRSLLRQRPVREIFETAIELRSAVGMVMDAASLLADPHLAARGAIVEVEHPGGQRYRMPGAPFIDVAASWRAEAAPLLGEGPVRTEQERVDVPPPGASLPLDGIRILDLTTAWAGPSATRILGALGADIIKIEGTRSYDGWRGPVTPPPRGIGNYADNDPGDRPYERTPLFGTANRNKRGVALDIASAEGRALFLRLVEKSDVVLSNFSARVLPNLKIGYDDLRSVKDDIILLSMPAFGNTGPYANGVAYGNTMEGMSGMSARFGYRDGAPLTTHDLTFGDPVAGAHAAVAVVSALWRRRRTGAGTLVDLSQQETMLAYMGDGLTALSAFGIESGRLGAASETFAPHGYYPCAGDDEWVAIAAESEEQWRSVARVLEPAWLDDVRFGSNAGRLENAAALDAAIAAVTSAWDKRAVAARLASEGAIASPVLALPELYGDAQIVGCASLELVTHPVAGTRLMPRVPVRLGGAPLATRLHAPTYGQDNAPVLKSLLELSDEQYEELARNGIVSNEPKGASE